MAEEKTKPSFKETLLNKQELESFKFFNTRKTQLQEARKNQHDSDLEQIWADADTDYIPHRLGTSGKKTLVEDETKGWRGASTLVRLGSSKWQSDISQPNPYIKIQTALAILIDQNPSGVFSASAKKYQNTTELMKQLYQRSWEVAKSKQQLKLFVFNLAKYGWACARTYPLRITRKVKIPTEYNEEDPSKTVYEEREVTEYNDIFRENLDPWNAWMDDMAKPDNVFSIRDWMWRKVYAMDAAEEEFGSWPLWKYVQPGGNVQEKAADVTGKGEKSYTETDLVEVYFYENRLKDLFMVIANGVPVIISPLPISDTAGNKKLSLWQTYWNLRSAKCPYGIGIYEAIRNEQALIDRIRNMTIDQLTLSIYKMFFYQGTQGLKETGDITISPGVGKQTIDPKSISWLDVPGPGKDAFTGLEMFKKDMDEASGITDPLMGEITGKTAFEVAQAKEAALKKLKVPLGNITDALDTEAYITISLIQLLYSIPEVYKTSDPELIAQYLQEIDSDPDLYERDDDGNFVARIYPEFPLNLDKDEKGNLIETQDTRFFRVKPRYLQWEGVINVKSQSILTPSKQVDKALELEMYNMLIPLLAQPPQLYSKVAKAIVKLYDKDPTEILPPMWLLDEQEMTAALNNQQPLFVDAEQAASGEAPQADTMIPSTQPPQNPQSMAGKMSSQLSQPFR